MATISDSQLREIGLEGNEVYFMLWLSGELDSKTRSYEMLSVFIQNEIEVDPAPDPNNKRFKTHRTNATKNYTKFRYDAYKDRYHLIDLARNSVTKPSVKYDADLAALLLYRAHYESLPS